MIAQFESGFFITSKGKTPLFETQRKYFDQGLIIFSYLDGDSLETCQSFLDMVDALVIIDYDNVQVYCDAVCDLVDYALEKAKLILHFPE